MPASEQTWRNQSLLHKIFAVTGVAMLVATVWMFAADHSREWKPFQRTTNRVEIQLAQWRKNQYLTDEATGKLQQIKQQLEAAREGSIPTDLVESFKQSVVSDAARRRSDENAIHTDGISESDVEATLNRIDRFQQTNEQGNVVGYDRPVVDGVLEPILARARFREDDLLRRRKFTAGNLDAAKANLGLAVRDQRPEADQAELQAKVDELKVRVDQLTLLHEAASAHRRQLQDLVARMVSTESELEKQLEEAQREVKRLESTIESRRSRYFETVWGIVPVPGKKWLEMPILDAFNSPLQIDNLWSDGLTQDFNFQDVRRFDRCTTCHQSIDKTLPGTPDQPAYVHERLVNLTLTIPEEEPGEIDGSGLSREELLNKRLEAAYGIKLAGEGLLTRDDVTVEYVRPTSAGAKAPIDTGRPQTADGAQIRRDLLVSARQALGLAAEDEERRPGLMVGDVLVAINEDPVRGRDRAALRLLDAIGNGSGQTMQITVRRGLPHPYTSHPRLDLFVGSLSPHNISEFACTICHEGQGSATSFKWASHTPNSLSERSEWMEEYGWFDNVHWIYPMMPKRFAESTCLKCHHDVVDLRPSERFPDPPAPTLMHGYDLVRKYGCYGCHEINGYEGPHKRIGPDMRLEPNYFAAAQAIRGEENSGYEELSDAHKELVNQLIQDPERTDVRRELYQAILEDADSDDPVLSQDIHQRIAPLLRDVETPGTLRKSGPALRFLEHKLDDAFLADWLLDPRHFRPTTKMPKFFGMWQHLDEPSREISEQFEPIEVLGVMEYLRKYSQDFEYLEQPKTDSPELNDQTVAALYDGDADEQLQQMVERGRAAFQRRGCLACHAHDDFPDAESFREPGEMVQGPDLSAIGTKFAPERNPQGYRWLYSWIKEPTRYHARTVMPDLLLDPHPVKDAEGNEITVDPVADIVAWLMAESHSDWKPVGEASLDAGDAEMVEALDRLTLELLRDAFGPRQAEQYAQTGIAGAAAEALKGSEQELIVEQPGLSNEQKLAYIGRKTIARYGCYGCHDIPGFEDAKPIGTGLADWGRKETSKLAFEHIIEYVHGGHGHGAHGGEEPHAGDDEDHSDHASQMASAEEAYGELPDFFLHQLESGHRAGFIYQKLREPRSYDYEKTRNKRYTERLRMPHFPFDNQQREAAITFVLGLVADPPNEKYVARPDARQQALIAGRKALEKYNCGGCHILDAERWTVSLDPDWQLYEGPTSKPSETYPFQRLNLPPSLLEASVEEDRRGRVHAELTILPKLGPRDGLPSVAETEEVIYPAGIPVADDAEYPRSAVAFDAHLLEPAAIDGMGYPPGEMLSVPASVLEKVVPSHGGFLSKYLLPHVTAEIGQDRGAEAWSWVPPILVGEGRKVQSNWLHEFLLNPYPIRPAAVLRMPRFNMSSREAAELVHYFAVKDGARHPYEFSSRQQSQYLQARDRAYGERLDPSNPPEGRRFEDAMKIVVDKKVYCAQCHQIGDYYPEGQPSGHGPDLTRVAERLREGYLHGWLADPKYILPYTAMPKNIPFDENKPLLGTTVPQDYYQGDSLQQLNALTDLLLNLDVYLEQKNSFSQMVQQAAPAQEPGAGEEPAAGAAETETQSTGAPAAGDAAAPTSASGAAADQVAAPDASASSTDAPEPDAAKQEAPKEESGGTGQEGSGAAAPQQGSQPGGGGQEDPGGEEGPANGSITGGGRARDAESQ